MRIFVGSGIGAAFLLGLFLMLSQIGCNDAPADTGSALLADTINGVTLTSRDAALISGDSEITNRLAHYNSGFLFIGRTPDAAAASLIRLTNIPDSLAMLTEANIISATMLMRPRGYIYGDTLNNMLSFDVREMTKAWITYADTSNTSAKIEPRWSDLFTTSNDPNPVWFSSEPIASFSGTLPTKADSTNIFKDIELPLNAAGIKLLVKWLQDTAEVTTTNPSKIYGLGFVPKSESKVIREFSSPYIGNTGDENRIRIKVKYSKPGSSVVDSLLLTSGNDATFTESERLQGNYIYTVPSVAHEGHIFFDVSMIPSTDAIVVAELTLTLDPSKTLKGNANRDSIPTLDYVDKSNKNPLPYAYSGIVNSQTNTVTFKGIQQALDWSRFKDTTAIHNNQRGKGTLYLRSARAGFERMAFFNNNAPDINLRPKLTIVYVKRPVLGGK